MPSSRYSIVEPHPSATSNTFIPTGRGGAGNITKVPSSVTHGSDASGPASQFSSLSSHSPTLKSRTFLTGRGGAGNIQHPPSERAIFSFDEELERQLSQERHAAPVYHVGRGGAGNVYGRLGRAQDVRVEKYLSGVDRRKSIGSDEESQKSGSSESVRSDASGAEFATKKMVRGWKKITGGY